MGWGEGDPRWDMPFSSHDGGSAGVHRCPVTLKSDYTGDNIQLEFYFIFLDFCAACQFSIAAVPKYNLVALTQHRFITSWSEARHGFHCAEIKMLPGRSLHPGPRGKKIPFLAFSSLQRPPDSSAQVPLHHLQSQQWQVSLMPCLWPFFHQHISF